MLMLRQGNDGNFCNKLLTQHAASSHLQKPSFKGRKVRSCSYPLHHSSAAA